MDPQLEKYYKDRMDMMCSQGWKDFIEDMQGIINATDRIGAVKDDTDLHFKRGELSILKMIVLLQEASEKAYEELKNENLA